MFENTTDMKNLNFEETDDTETKKDEEAELNITKDTHEDFSIFTLGNQWFDDSTNQNVTANLTDEDAVTKKRKFSNSNSVTTREDIDLSRSSHIHIINENNIYDVATFNKPSIALGVWNRDQKLVKLRVLRGNFWKVFGFSVKEENFLFPEEALFLYERKQINIIKNDEHDTRLTLKEFYEQVLEVISLPCYLSYAKLKSLEYVTIRNQIVPTDFASDDQIKDVLERSTNQSTLLDNISSFKVYLRNNKWSKKMVGQIQPTSYVIITSCRNMFSPEIIMRLLDESKGVPILFGVVQSSCNILFEELSDAEISLSFENDLAIPNDFSEPFDINEMMSLFNANRNKSKIQTISDSEKSNDFTL